MIEIEEGVWIPRELWAKISHGDVVIEHSDGVPLSEIFQPILDSQESIPEEFQQILDDNFWDLLED